MIIGNPLVFAIESNISQPYRQLSQRALGFFIIHVGGRSYGIRSPEASLLACSFDAVQQRIAQRGMHTFLFNADAASIADAFCAATYDEDRQDESFFGLSCTEFRDSVVASQIIWAPDGDSAFDDGSHVLQIDQDTRVRLIAFKNMACKEDIIATLSEVWVDVNEFYEILAKWQEEFEKQWMMAFEQKS